MAKIAIRVIPKSRHQKLKFDGDTLKVWVNAPPIEGRANDELVEILAKYLKISKINIAIIAGFSSKNKLVDIVGVNVEELKKSLG